MQVFKNGHWVERHTREEKSLRPMTAVLSRCLMVAVQHTGCMAGNGPLQQKLIIVSLLIGRKHQSVERVSLWGAGVSSSVCQVHYIGELTRSWPRRSESSR